MSLCGEVLTINAFGDWTATATMRDESGAVVDLTGFSVSIVDATGVLAGAVSASIVNAALGQIRIAVTWQAGWPLIAGHLGTARVLLLRGGDESTTLPFAVQVSGRALRLELPRGADQAYAFTWPNDRDGASLVGETVDLINVSPALAGFVSVVVIDAATRACEVRIEGDLSVALGDAGTFQLRRRIAGAQPRTLPPVAVSFA